MSEDYFTDNNHKQVKLDRPIRKTTDGMKNLSMFLLGHEELTEEENNQI